MAGFLQSNPGWIREKHPGGEVFWSTNLREETTQVGKSNQSPFLFPSFWADEGKPTTVSLCKIYRPHRCIPSLRRNAKPRRQKAPWARKHLWNWCFFRKTDRKFTCFLLLGIFGSKKKTMKCQFCCFLFTHRNFKDSHQHPWYLLYIEQEFPVLTAS